MKKKEEPALMEYVRADIRIIEIINTDIITTSDNLGGWDTEM